MAVAPKNIIRGNFGEIWLNGDKVGECKKFEAKVEKEKEEVKQCGKLATDTRTVGYKGTGTMTIYKVNSRMINLLDDAIKTGQEVRFQVLVSLNDPSALGAERVLIKDADFDDETLANFEAGALGEIDCPFTFTDWEKIDTIAPKEA